MFIDSQTVLPGREIPRQHTPLADNTSPGIKWGDVPEATATFVVICEDTDAADDRVAGWVVFDIPGHMRHLRQGVPRVAELESGARHGRNDYGRLGWDGPSPPAGDAPHTYVIRVYALDTHLGLEPGASRQQVLDAMQGHVLDEVELPGVFGRAVTA